MTLDTAVVLGGQGGQQQDEGARLSTPGCALLAAMLGFPKVLFVLGAAHLGVS